MTHTVGRRTTRRLVSRLLAVLLLTAVAGVGLAGPAAAHNVLIASDPADGATLQQSPATVRLTFDQPVQDFEPIVTVVGPDGQRYESGDPVVDSTVVSAQVNALPAAGSYVVAYRVVSADGHPVQGEIRFELAAAALEPTAPVSSPAVSSPPLSSSAVSSAGGSTTGASTSAAASAPTSAPTSTAGSAPTATSSGLTGWMWAAIGLAAILVAAAVTVLLRRPRQRQ